MSTIAAIATPVGSGGIGIIKISGPQAVTIANAIFIKNSHKKKNCFNTSSFFKSHHFYHGNIIDSESHLILDEVLLVYMKGPKSYTTEEVIEIHAHSGPFVLRAILDLVIQKGAQLAEPGEFTKRAYMNGRIDLTQAEAVIDIINARTSNALNIAISQIEGGIKETVEKIRNELIDLYTKFEAIIDFPEDVGDIINIDNILNGLDNRVASCIHELIEHYDNAHFLRDGIKLSIIGAPNVGKSSLMNSLINKEKSIVTSIPGTTRDIIEESLNLNGLPFIITDTAGIHETEDPVEIIGIRKARKQIEISDIILFLVDACASCSEEDIKILDSLDEKRVILVINKIDQVDENIKFDLPEVYLNISKVNISAKYNKGIKTLKKKINEISTNEVKEYQSQVVPNLRHKNALEKALNSIEALISGLKTQVPYELLAIDISEAIEGLEEILGTQIKIDILDNIFNNFCIGK